MVLREHGWQGKVPPGGNPVAGSTPSLLMTSDAAVSKMSMGDVWLSEIVDNDKVL